MKISVKVKPGAKKESLERVDDTNFIAHVKAPPVEGKANEALVRLLSDYFGVPKSRVQIIKGAASKYKLVHLLIQ